MAKPTKPMWKMFDTQSLSHELLAKIAQLGRQMEDATTFETYLACVMALGQMIATTGQAWQTAAYDRLKLVIEGKALQSPTKSLTK